MIIKDIHKLILCLIISINLLACGGSGDDTTMGRASPTGALTLNITDAVIDDAKEVWVEFSAISLQPSNGTSFEITFNSVKKINLLALQGTLFTDLVDQVIVPAGTYDWLRLHVNATEDGVFDSYITLLDGNIYELDIPSGSQSGLKINTGYEVILNKKLNMMVDFDLRKSIILSSEKYKLRPSLRLVNTDNTDTITGDIDISLLTAAVCSDNDPETGNAVYLFEGSDTAPDDIDGITPEPVTSANVLLNPTSGKYEYIIGFVPYGDYTLAFTCQADLDKPNEKNNIFFSYTENINVTETFEPPVIPPAR